MPDPAFADIQRPFLNEQANAVIASWRTIHDELAVFRVRLDDGAPFDFEPGQYTRLGLPEGYPPAGDAAAADPHALLKREYSMASAKQDRDGLEFYAVRVGDLTQKLWRLGVGGRLWVDAAAYGRFTLAGIAAGRDLIMVATGTGVAPYVSMLRTYRGAGRWRRCVLIHGVRETADLGYREELEALAAEDASVFYWPVVSRESAGAGATTGHVEDALRAETFRDRLGFDLAPDHSSIFLCGNPAMVDQTEAQLHARGFTTHTDQTPGNIHFERYW